MVKFFHDFLGLAFPGFQAPPPHKKNSRLKVTQNCRHSSPISPSRTLFFTAIFCLLARFGILPGLYGMENGQKPEMEKKLEIGMENGPKLDGAKNGKKMAQKRKHNGKRPQKSIFGPFFCHFFLRPGWGRFPFRFPFFFFPFPPFGCFPCHTSPAGSQGEIKILFSSFI